MITVISFFVFFGRVCLLAYSASHVFCLASSASPVFFRTRMHTHVYVRHMAGWAMAAAPTSSQRSCARTSRTLPASPTGCGRVGLTTTPRRLWATLPLPGSRKSWYAWPAPSPPAPVDTRVHHVRRHACLPCACHVHGQLVAGRTRRDFIRRLCRTRQ